MTPDQFSAIRARLDAATPGPWTIEEGGGEEECLVFVRTKRGRVVRTIWMNDATFVANAPADLRALLDEVERLTKREDVLVKAGLDLMVANKDLTAERDAAFKRGAEAMRESAAQLVHQEVEGWMQLGLSGDIRTLPIPEDKP